MYTFMAMFYPSVKAESQTISIHIQADVQAMLRVAMTSSIAQYFSKNVSSVRSLSRRNAKGGQGRNHFLQF